MRTEEALNFLEQHQPMPGDALITQDQCDLFVAALNHFKNNPDVRCISLFINSIGHDTGLGMYESISEVLRAHEKSRVVEEIKYALSQSSDSVKYRCCWWATDLNAWNLEEYIWPLVKSRNEDLSEAARLYIKLKNENGY